MQLAKLTLQAINDALEVDQGARYRGFLGEAIKECHDAFDSRYDPKPRKHLGASLIGKTCARALWYSFRWCNVPKFDGRMIRLFNRGHLEEARFIALLRTGGLTTWHSDNGKQFKISGHRGHFGGSLDGVGTGVLEIGGKPCLLEFKTHGSKSYAKLVKEGVDKAKPEHVVQCNQYMGYWKLEHTLYCGVNKDTDELHLEILNFDYRNQSHYFDRAGKIIESDILPPKINSSPAWFDCKFCDMRMICHHGCAPTVTCRTCAYVQMVDDGNWQCTRTFAILSPDEQFSACDMHVTLGSLR